MAEDVQELDRGRVLAAQLGDQAVEARGSQHVARGVEGGTAEVGVLVCGTGQGMAMSANRHPGVRAAVITDAFTAEMARGHNNANVACFGERVVGVEQITSLLKVFLETEFEGGRHARRVDKIER